MRVRYTPRARADLEAIFSYLDSRNPIAARSVKREIERSAVALALLPYLGVVIDRSPEFRACAPGAIRIGFIIESETTRCGSSIYAMPHVGPGAARGIDLTCLDTIEE